MQPRPISTHADYFVLSAWCTVGKTWNDLPTRWERPADARAAACERGIYGVTYVREGRRLNLDTFAVVGDD
jgi:hypothetical protein